jgi:hypothetical protein
MTEDAWRTAVEDAGDALGEMLIEMAEDDADHTHEDLARVVLRAGLTRLLAGAPDSARVEAAAAVLHAAVHKDEPAAWRSLSAAERAFWLGVAENALRAADEVLLRTADRPAA